MNFLCLQVLQWGSYTLIDVHQFFNDLQSVTSSYHGSVAIDARFLVQI